MYNHLQKVIPSAASSSRDSTLILGNSTEYAKLGVEVLTDVHDRCNIAAAVAVVGCGPDRNNRLLRKMILQTLEFEGAEVREMKTHLVAFIDELVGTSDKLQTINVVELSRDLVSEEPARAARRNSPCLNILRVAPNQITEGPLVGDLLSTGNDTNLIDRPNLRAQSTMNAENLAVNNSSKDEEVKNLAARLPDRGIPILLLAFLIETINLGNLTGLMIASNESNLIRVPLYY